MRNYSGISENVDGCQRLIAQLANKAWARLDSSHQRWIDREDLEHEGFLTAIRDVEPTYREKRTVGRSAKFSSYLYTGVDWHLKRLVTATRVQMRATKLVELDRPTEEGSSLHEVIPAHTSGAVVSRTGQQWAFSVEQLNCIQAFVTLCRAVSQGAIVVLVRGFLFSDTRRSTPELCAEIGAAATKLHIGINDLRLVPADENIRKIVLHLVSRDVIMSEETEEALRVLQCQGCDGQFSIAALRGPNRRFYLSTMTCRSCYNRLYRKPVVISCFGKPKANGGYTPTDKACRLHCADRAVCRAYSKGNTGDDMAKDELEDVDLSGIETGEEAPAEAPKPKGKAKTKKADKKPAAKKGKGKAAAKPAKKPKAEEVPWTGAYAIDAIPKDVVEWPYKRGSVMLYAFQAMHKGVEKKAFEKDIAAFSAGASFNSLGPKAKAEGEKTAKNMLAHMRKHQHKKHTWKLDEEGARLKIFDVKYQGAKKTKAAGK